MTPRSTIPLLLLAAMIVVGGGRRVGSSCAPGMPSVESDSAMGESGAAVAQPVLRKVEPVDGSESTRSRAVAVVGGLSGESYAALAEQAAVRMAVSGAELDLTAEQWSALGAVTAHYQTVRQTFEATIATVSARDALRLDIPAYPAAGDALREKFFSELRERLGDAAADQIVQRAGVALEGYFGGFGVGVQTIEFSPGAVVAAADYQVTRTAQYWNSVEDRAGLTLRRETYFPALEDPSGERWGPLLARLTSRAAGNTGS